MEQWPIDPANFPSFPPPAIALQPPPLPAHDPLPPFAPIEPTSPVGPAGSNAYNQDIHAHLRSLEIAPGRRPSPDYMETTSVGPVTPPMRAVLVEFLASLAPTFRFHSRTLHLAVFCLDKFLAARDRPAIGSAGDLIPVAAASLLLASKYENVHSQLMIDELVSEARRALIDCDGDCTRDDLLNAELAVLKAVKFDMGTPTAHTFLEHFSERLRLLHFHGSDGNSKFLASYIAELGLLHYDVLRFRPSMLAASAMLVARLTARPSESDKPWGSEFEEATEYTAAELKECAETLHRLHRNCCEYRSASGFVHMKKKYSHSMFNSVSTLPPPADIQIPSKLVPDVVNMD